MKNHETVLPEGYREIKHINALDKKLGLILNAIALAVTLVILLIALIPFFTGAMEFVFDTVDYFVAAALYIAGMVLYLVLHELAHGAAYKLLTREKLTFGISWSCAWCGVPNVYVYRKASLIALVTPLILFTVILIPLTLLMLPVNHYAYLAMALIFGLHLGGCSGDIYMTLLLLFKYRDPALLVRDTGPEQYLYLKESEN